MTDTFFSKKNPYLNDPPVKKASDKWNLPDSPHIQKSKPTSSNFLSRNINFFIHTTLLLLIFILISCSNSPDTGDLSLGGEKSASLATSSAVEEEMIEEQIEKKKQEVRALAPKWRKSGRDPQPLETLRVEFNRLMKSGEQSKALMKLEEMLVILNEPEDFASEPPGNDIASQIQSQMQTIQKLMPSFAQSGGDVSIIQILLKEFEKFAKSGDALKALGKLNEVVNILKENGQKNFFEKDSQPGIGRNHEKVTEKKPQENEPFDSHFEISNDPSSSIQYLIFQIFTGGGNPETGIFDLSFNKSKLDQIVKKIKRDISPNGVHPYRKLGFSVGPLTLDQTDGELRKIIRDSYEVALENDMAVAFHIDDYMFWKKAKNLNGKLLSNDPNNKEWIDWQGSPAKGLKIGWMVGRVGLAPQMCYESRDIKQHVARISHDVMGKEIKEGLGKLSDKGKEDLFAGVMVGWESNMADGYCSLSQRGFSAGNPPKDFVSEIEKITHDHIKLWSKGIYDAGIPKEFIFTHIAVTSKTEDELRKGGYIKTQLYHPTIFDGSWIAFNTYSNPGYSTYPMDERVFKEIYRSLKKHNHTRWASAEGTNVIPFLAITFDAVDSIMDWETYLAKMFNHGAAMVNIFGGWQGEGYGPWGKATESREAIAAYQKFLRGEKLKENKVLLFKADLGDRIQNLGKKVSQYQRNGGDMGILLKETKTLEHYLKEKNRNKAEKTLNKIEDILR